MSGPTTQAMMDFNAAVYADFALTDHVAVGGRIAWMSLLDSDARDAEPYWDARHAVGWPFGVGLLLTR
jgi:hypothetical protein